MSTIGLFDVINNITSSSTKIEFEEISGVYAPFMINKALSNNKDLVFIANEMNVNWWLDKDMQYDFLHSITLKKKRWGKWNKKTDDKDNIEIVMKYYNYSYSKAKEIIDLVDIDFIKKSMEIGGLKK